MLSYAFKNAAKRVYYAVKPARLAAGIDLSLAHVVHTERVYDRAPFEALMAFCREFTRLTGKRPICTAMPGTNPRIEGGCRRHGLSDVGYAERLAALSEVAILGYHGHYWVDPELVRAREALASGDAFHSAELELRCNNFVEAPLRAQLAADVDWFASHRLDTNGAYAGGWWFTNHRLLSLLIDRGFRYDFTFSCSPWFRSEYSYMLLESNQISPGEVFSIRRGDAEMLCVQTLLGGHRSPFVDDFRRNLGKVLAGQTRVVGAVSTHDYDLDPVNTLACLRALRDEDRARFFDLGDLRGGMAPGRRLRFQLERC